MKIKMSKLRHLIREVVESHLNKTDAKMDLNKDPEIQKILKAYEEQLKKTQEEKEKKLAAYAERNKVIPPK